MNVAFFLTPKQDVVWIPARSSMRQALERMEHHRYSAVPLLDDEGLYVGTLTEGDLLWKMKAERLTVEDAENVPVIEVKRRFAHRAVRIDARIDALFHAAIEQNFVPVIDDRGVFVGIVRRRVIIEHLIERAEGR